MHKTRHSLRLIAMSAVALAACQRPAPAPPSVAAHPAAGTYRLKVVRRAVDFPAKNPLEAVLVLNQGRLPAAVARQLTTTYFTRADERTALGEACIRWEIPLWSNRPAYALRHPSGTSWRRAAFDTSTLQLMLLQSRDMRTRYIVTLDRQPDGSLVGGGTWTFAYPRTRVSTPADSIVATRLGDANPTQCLRDPEQRVAAAEPFAVADGAAGRRTPAETLPWPPRS